MVIILSSFPCRIAQFSSHWRAPIYVYGMCCMFFFCWSIWIEDGSIKTSGNISLPSANFTNFPQKFWQSPEKIRRVEFYSLPILSFVAISRWPIPYSLSRACDVRFEFQDSPLFSVTQLVRLSRNNRLSLSVHGATNHPLASYNDSPVYPSLPWAWVQTRISGGATQVSGPIVLHFSLLTFEFSLVWSTHRPSHDRRFHFIMANSAIQWQSGKGIQRCPWTEWLSTLYFMVDSSRRSNIYDVVFSVKQWKCYDKCSQPWYFVSRASLALPAADMLT